MDQQQAAFKQVAVRFVWRKNKWRQGPQSLRLDGEQVGSGGNFQSVWCQDLTAEAWGTAPSTGLQYIRSLGCLLVLHHNLNPRWITWMLEQILCVFKVIIQWMFCLFASQPWKDSPVFLHLWLCVFCLCRSTYLKTTSTISQMLRVTPSG